MSNETIELSKTEFKEMMKIMWELSWVAEGWMDTYAENNNFSEEQSNSMDGRDVLVKADKFIEELCFE